MDGNGDMNNSGWQLTNEHRWSIVNTSDSEKIQPEHIAVYGTLQYGGAAWPLLGPLVADSGMSTTVPGTLYDTTCGYPALKLDSGPGAPAQLFQLNDPHSALPLLDSYEGPEYNRKQLLRQDGLLCWVYVWRSTVAGMTPLPRGWPL